MRMNENGKKREIREIALRLFQEKGYDNVTVNEISRSSNISKNTFYYYFDSKETLILDLFRAPLGLESDLTLQLLQYSDPLAQIYCIADRTSGHFERLGREVVKKALAANLSRSNEWERPMDHREDNVYRQLLLDAFCRAQEQKRIRTDRTSAELLRCAAVQLMGCVQIWATAPQDHMDRTLAQMFRSSLSILLEVNHENS